MYKLIFIFFSLFIYASTGEGIYNAKGCYGCHGPKAMGDGGYPALASKKQSFLIKRLKYFKNGRMKTSKSYLMAPFAKSLSDEDINSLALYLSNLAETNISYEESEYDASDAYGGGGS